MIIMTILTVFVALLFSYTGFVSGLNGIAESNSDKRRLTWRLIRILNDFKYALPYIAYK